MRRWFGPQWKSSNASTEKRIGNNGKRNRKENISRMATVNGLVRSCPYVVTQVHFGIEQNEGIQMGWNAFWVFFLIEKFFLLTKQWWIIRKSLPHLHIVRFVCNFKATYCRHFLISAVSTEQKSPLKSMHAQLIWMNFPSNVHHQWWTNIAFKTADIPRSPLINRHSNIVATISHPSRKRVLFVKGKTMRWSHCSLSQPCSMLVDAAPTFFSAQNKYEQKNPHHSQISSGYRKLVRLF